MSTRYGVIFLKNFGAAGIAAVGSPNEFDTEEAATSYAHCENIFHGSASIVMSLRPGETADSVLFTQPELVTNLLEEQGL